MRIITIIILTCVISFVQAQKKDTIQRKNLRFSILGGPGYTPDYGLLIGGSALFTFSTNQADTTLKRSVLPIAFAYMAAGGGSVIVRPQLFYNKDRFRIFGQLSMSNTIDNYYGVGFETNSDRIRGKDSTEYRYVGFSFNPIFLFRYKSSNLFLGPSLDVTHTNMQDPSIGVQNDPDYMAHGGNENGLEVFNVGLGANFSYDTRDVPANAYSGMLLELNATFYSKAFGSTNNFNVYNLQYRQFKELKFIGERKVLAWMINGRFTSGDVPLTELSSIGSAFDLRGYYMGQYRDKNAVMTLAEYRHMLNMGDETKMRRILSKLGFTTWAGLGSTDPDFKDWSGVMPNFGAGLRIELQPRMNFRIDVGHDPLNNQTLLYFNMTEAF